MGCHAKIISLSLCFYNTKHLVSHANCVVEALTLSLLIGGRLQVQVC